MALNWLIDDAPQYVSRGTRIRSVLDGSGSIDLVPGRPDVEATAQDWDKREKFNPDIDIDLNAFSRIDKFDALEVGQRLIDDQLDKPSSSSTVAEAEEK